MPFLLVRHGRAVEGGGAIDDEARWLTQQGRATSREVARALRAEKLLPARIFTSPLVRAVQTAELFAEQLGFAGEIEVLPALTYTAPPELAVGELKRREQGLLIAAFGHMPTLADIARGLISSHRGHSFQPSEALLIDGARPSYRVDPAEARVERL